MKVKLIYTPENGSKREWVFDPDNPPWDLAYVTEVETGWPWEEFLEKVSKGSHIALRALVFAFRKREEQRLSLQSIQVTSNELDIEEVEEPKMPDAMHVGQEEGSGGPEA